MDDVNAYFMDPSTDDAYAYIPIEELMRRWHDYENEGKDGHIRRYVQAAIIYSGTDPIEDAPETRRVLRLR